jgi:geranylgeranyl diphosphate synthase type II
MDLKTYIDHQRTRVDTALDRFLPPEDMVPATMHRAMRHSMFAGGKRLRPVLCLAAAEALGETGDTVLAPACALETLHTFTLIHDDLPCMDDDDLRRGKPTCHKVFGDAVAVLAGDALQALSFELVSDLPAMGRYGASDFVHALAIASGSRNVVAGQVLDLEAEGRDLSYQELRTIHERKTAALLACAMRFGAMAGDATQDQLVALESFGWSLGLAFQVIDDILDTTQTSETLGKTAGKDATVGKATYPSILGMDASRREAKQLTAAAKDALASLGADASRLREIADYMLDRDY